jgi:uncharacterized damage-inducible protein DinB
MTIKDIDDVYTYSDWANEKLLKVVEELTPEEFTTSGLHESIRTTLVHMLSAEWGWLARCGGLERGPRLVPTDFPDLLSIRETWSRVRRGRREFLSSLSDEDVNREITESDGSETQTLTLGEMMGHAANHNAHHRGQVSLLLRMLGHPPVDVDQLFYHLERRGAPASRAG